MTSKGRRAARARQRLTERRYCDAQMGAEELLDLLVELAAEVPPNVGDAFLRAVVHHLDINITTRSGGGKA